MHGLWGMGQMMFTKQVSSTPALDLVVVETFAA